MAITDFINASYTAEIAERARQVAIHQTDADTMYMGEASEAGFTVLTATSADDFLTKLNTACASLSSYVVERAWNGLSTASGYAVNGPLAGSLTANASAPGGYNRPATGRVIVRDAVGYTPDFTCFDNVLAMYGVNRIHFKGGTWSCGFYFGPGSAPLPSCAAFTDDIVIDGDGFSKFGIQFLYAWSIHLEDVQFLRNWACVSGSPIHYRAWNCSSLYGRNNDIQGFRSFDSSPNDWIDDYMSTIWVAGWKIFHTDSDEPSDGLHPDFCQLMNFADRHEGYNLIVEFNVVHMDGKRNPDGYYSQGLFGNSSSDAGGSLNHTVNAIVHNNIFAVGAFWALHIPDPEDNGVKMIHRNIAMRCAYHYQFENDAYPYVVMERDGAKPAGTGSGIISENYYFRPSWDIVVTESSNVTIENNITLDPRAAAAVGTSPPEVLSGTDGNGGGWTGGDYVRPETGQTTAAGSADAFFAFAEPQVGWRGAGAGPMDPATWPTDYLTLQAGEPPSLPVMGRNITINLTAGA